MYWTVHRKGATDTQPIRGEEFTSKELAQPLIDEMQGLTKLEYEAVEHEDRPVPPDVVVGQQPFVRKEVGPNKFVVGYVLNDTVKRLAKQFSVTEEVVMQFGQMCYNEGAEHVEKGYAEVREKQHTLFKEPSVECIFDWRKALMEDDEPEDESSELKVLHKKLGETITVNKPLLRKAVETLTKDGEAVNKIKPPKVVIPPLKKSKSRKTNTKKRSRRQQPIYKKTK